MPIFCTHVSRDTPDVTLCRGRLHVKSYRAHRAQLAGSRSQAPRSAEVPMCMYFDEAGQHRTDEGSCITWMSECLTQADYYVFGMEFLEPRSKGKFPRNADTEILGFRDEAGGNWTDEGCEVLLVEETRIQCGRSGGGRRRFVRAPDLAQSAS